MIQLLWENIFKKQDRAMRRSLVLGNNKIFSGLNKKELLLIKDLVHERHYRSGEIIFRQGETALGMYIIAKGCVEITVIEELAEASITKLRSGDFFGEISLAEENSKRGATATAIEDTVLIGFFKPDLDVIIKNHPSIAIKITICLAQVLATRLKVTTDKISSLRTEIKSLSELDKTNENSTATYST